MNEVEKVPSLIWKMADLKSGFGIYGGAYAPPGYCKDLMGFVHLRGLTVDGGLGPDNPVFFLDEGYRPEYSHEFQVANFVETDCKIIIEKTGKVWVETLSSYWPQLVAGKSRPWISLDGVNFAAITLI